jgi:hypothetical protein
MDTIAALIVFLVLAGSAAILVLITRRVSSGRIPGLRPHPGYDSIGDQVNRAVEGGRKVHYGLGTGSFTGQSAMTSLASISILDHLAQNACASGVPPLITVGDATLLPAARDSLQQAYDRAGRRHAVALEEATFISDSAFPTTYAAGAMEKISDGTIGSNMLIGRFGTELILLGESGARDAMDQIIGSDDPAALSVATAITDKILLGEELYVSGAYVDPTPGTLATLQFHDLARVLVATGVLIAALLYLVVA